jgi:hypothetical protein
MRKILHKVLAIFLLLLLAGCASSVQKNLDRFMGMDILEAQKHFGYNFKTTKLSDENTAYTWIRNKSSGAVHQGSGGFASHQCEFSLVADPSGKIISNMFRDTHHSSSTCWKLMD